LTAIIFNAILIITEIKQDIRASMTIFVDLETSGLSPEHGARILSFGLIADDGTVTSPIQELEVHVIPTEEQWAQASLQALDVNGLTMEFLQANGVPLPTAIRQVCD
jgi:DNA polymerase III epsilon subunit-like protein